MMGILSILLFAGPLTTVSAADGPDLDSLQRVVDSLREIAEERIYENDDAEYDTLIQFEQKAHGGTIKITHSPDDIVQMGGDVIVDATTRVRGDAVALGGNMTVHGIVEGDAVAIGGSLYLEPGSHVKGDAVSIGGRVKKSESASVGGEIVSIGPGMGSILPWIYDTERTMAERIGSVIRSSFIGYLLIFFLILIFVDLFGGATDRACTYVAGDVVKSGLVGFLILLLTPVIIGVLAVTVIGLPVIPLYLLGLVVVFFWGMVAVSLEAGRVWGTRILPNLSHARWLALLGAVLLTLPKYAGKLLAAIGGPLHIVGWSLSVVGSVILFVAICVGMGSLVMSKLGRRSMEWTDRDESAIDPVDPDEPDQGSGLPAAD
ncbi:MAG: hypothetical protein HKN20_10785 [Gemmatimonadetes bacterium]|nr:hypothetical protein [Gemmatimonadota bacterium]